MSVSITDVGLQDTGSEDITPISDPPISVQKLILSCHGVCPVLVALSLLGHNYNMPQSEYILCTLTWGFAILFNLKIHILHH